MNPIFPAAHLEYKFRWRQNRIQFCTGSFQKSRHGWRHFLDMSRWQCKRLNWRKKNEMKIVSIFYVFPKGGEGQNIHHWMGCGAIGEYSPNRNYRGCYKEGGGKGYRTLDFLVDFCWFFFFGILRIFLDFFRFFWIIFWMIIFRFFPK